MGDKFIVFIFKCIVLDVFNIKLNEKNKLDLRIMFRKVICDYCCIVLIGSKYIGNFISFWENCIDKDIVSLFLIIFWFFKM